MAESIISTGGSTDVIEWGKRTNPDTGEEEKLVTLPFTRNQNVLGRPALSTSAKSELGEDIIFLATYIDEMDDNIIFNLAKQVW